MSTDVRQIWIGIAAALILVGVAFWGWFWAPAGPSVERRCATVAAVLETGWMVNEGFCFIREDQEWRYIDVR